MTQPATPGPPEVSKASQEAQALAGQWRNDDTLARTKGSSPHQVEARRRVVTQFCEIHFPEDTADQRSARLADIDCTRPTTIRNGRTVNLANPKSKSLFASKPAYLVSAKYPPASADAPIYALEYFPLRS